MIKSVLHTCKGNAWCQDKHVSKSTSDILCNMTCHMLNWIIKGRTKGVTKCFNTDFTTPQRIHLILTAIWIGTLWTLYGYCFIIFIKAQHPELKTKTPRPFPNWHLGVHLISIHLTSVSYYHLIFQKELWTKIQKVDISVKWFIFVYIRKGKSFVNKQVLSLHSPICCQNQPHSCEIYPYQ